MGERYYRMHGLKILCEFLMHSLMHSIARVARSRRLHLSIGNHSRALKENRVDRPATQDTFDAMAATDGVVGRQRDCVGHGPRRRYGGRYRRGRGGLVDEKAMALISMSESVARTRNRPREQPLTVGLTLGLSLVSYSAEGNMLGRQELYH